MQLSCSTKSLERAVSEIQVLKGLRWRDWFNTVCGDVPEPPQSVNRLRCGMTDQATIGEFS